MADTATPDVIAESSPAAAAPAPQEPVAPPSDQAGYDRWRQTGEVKPSKPKDADPATAKEESSETAPAPEAGTKEPHAKPRGNAETRLSELLADLKTAGLSPSELKTFKREQAQRQDAAAPKVEAPKAEQPKQAKSDRPPRPVFGDKEGETWEQYQDRDSEWVASIADYAVQNYRRQQQQELATKELRGQVDAAKGRYGPEAESSIGTAIDTLIASEIPGAVKAIINDSPVLIDLAYVMGSKPGELAEFLALAQSNPSAAIRRVVLMEKLVQEELAKGSSATSGSEGAAVRGEDGKFVSTKVPEKKTTAAPPPPTEVNGRGSGISDEGARAASTGDFESFRQSRNRADLDRIRGR